MTSLFHENRERIAKCNDKYELDANALVNATERLEDEQSGVVDEVVETGRQEEVVGEHLQRQHYCDVTSFNVDVTLWWLLWYRLAFDEFLLCAVEVEVDVETLEELRDRIAIHVRLLQERVVLK